MEGFLPPEPPGPEPELGRPPQAVPPPPQLSPPPEPPQPAWQQPAAYGPVPPSPYPIPAEPSNGPAVAGFVLSVVSGGLLLLSLGTSSIVSVVCAALGIYYARQGKRRVERGETRRSGDLAQAGAVVGWVALGLSILATLAWVLVVVLAIASDGVNGDSGGQLSLGLRWTG